MIRQRVIAFLDDGSRIAAVTSAPRMESADYIIEGLPAVRLRQQLREIRATLKSVGAA